MPSLLIQLTANLEPMSHKRRRQFAVTISGRSIATHAINSARFGLWRGGPAPTSATAWTVEHEAAGFGIVFCHTALVSMALDLLFFCKSYSQGESLRC